MSKAKATIHELDPIIVMRGNERVCVADTEKDALEIVEALNKDTDLEFELIKLLRWANNNMYFRDHYELDLCTHCNYPDPEDHTSDCKEVRWKKDTKRILKGARQ